MHASAFIGMVTPSLMRMDDTGTCTTFMGCCFASADSQLPIQRRPCNHMQALHAMCMVGDALVGWHQRPQLAVYLILTSKRDRLLYHVDANVSRRSILCCVRLPSCALGSTQASACAPHCREGRTRPRTKTTHGVRCLAVKNVINKHVLAKGCCWLLITTRRGRLKRNLSVVHNRDGTCKLFHPLAKVLTHLGPAENGRPRVLTAWNEAGIEASGA